MIERESHPLNAFNIVLIYAVLAGVWILLSDLLVNWLFASADQAMLASTLKGWLFVSVTSLILFVLLRRRMPDQPVIEPLPSQRTLMRSMLWLMLLIFSLCAAAIYYVFGQVRHAETARLQAVSTVMAQQVDDWRNERMGDARMIQSSRFLAEHYARWRNQGDQASLALMTGRLTDNLRQFPFSSIMLLDAKGELVWRNQSDLHVVDAAQRSAFLSAAQNGEVAMLGPYLDTHDQLHLDIVVPLLAQAGEPAGIVILHTDTLKYLSNLLRAWQSIRTRGEVMLLIRDGEEVLQFDATDQHQTFLTRLPLARRSLLSAQAINHQEKLGFLLEGMNDRGVRMLGVAQAIPDGNWVLLAKLDHNEFYSAAYRDAAWIVLAALLLAFIAAAGLYFTRQRQQLHVAAQVRTAQNERLRALHLLAAIADSSSDMIYAKDLQGRYQLFNRAAERWSGKTSRDVLGQDDTALCPLEQSALIMQNDQAVIAGNCNLAFQEDLTTTEGNATFLATKGPLLDESGNVVGLYGISRDISQRKRAESLLTATAGFVSSAGGEDFFPALVRQAAESLALDVVYVARFDASRLRIEILSAWQDDEWIEPWSQEIADTPCADLVHQNLRCIEADVQAKYPAAAELKRFGAQGYVGAPLTDPAGQHIGVLTGLSRLPLRNIEMLQANLSIMAARASAEWQQRQANWALFESERSFRLLTEQVPAIIYRASLDDSSQTQYVSPKVVDLGYSQADWIQDPDAWVNALHPDDRPRVLQALVEFHAAGGELALEYRLRDTQGVWHYFQDQAQILHDETGQPLYKQGIMLDVTARHDAAAQLSAARARTDMLADLLNRSAQPFCQFFVDGRVGFHNPAFLDLLGYTEEEFARLENSADLSPLDWLKFEHARLDELRLGGKSVSYERECQRQDGGRVPVELLVHLIRDEQGEPSYFYAFITDITQRKLDEAHLRQQTEELRQRNDELERFNRVSVGRELDMIKLKQTINALSLKLGQKPPFDLSFVDADAPSTPSRTA